jgi:transcriptional regulator with PAS, ATPase and Fis domain
MSCESCEIATAEEVLGGVQIRCGDSVHLSMGRDHLLRARQIFGRLGWSDRVGSIDRLLAETEKRWGLFVGAGGVAAHEAMSRRRGTSPIPDTLKFGILTCDERITGDLARWGESEVRVLIEGETGVGKELVARAMHSMSRRREEQFVAVDCGALSETLAESELFGHVRGSFTGADRDRVGLIESANGGTLLLDEVGELSEALQSKLLRVLEEGVVRRVGENRTRAVDVRVLSATTKDLGAEVDAGRFRRDLYYRLKGVVVRVPSLRERRGDVELLLDHFLETYNERCGKGVKLSAEAWQALLGYEWPGNVRELKHVVEVLVVSARDGAIVGVDAVEEFLEASESGPVAGCDTNEVEDREIRRALDACGGNKAEAARRLGISRKTLYRRMQDPQSG